MAAPARKNSKSSRNVHRHDTCQRKATARGKAFAKKVVPRIKARTERCFLTVEKGTLRLAERYGEEAETLMKREGLVAVAERYGGVEELLGGDDVQVTVMWNDLPKGDDNLEYQIHHHVKFSNVIDGKAKPKFKENPAILEKKEQLDELEIELSTKPKKKAKKSKKSALRAKSNLESEIAHLENNEPTVPDGCHAPNSHILEFPFGPTNKEVKCGGCSVLDDEAIRIAVEFKDRAIEDPAHLATADRKQKPKYKAHRRLISFGKEMVEWDEDKGENQHYGFKLFWDESEVVWTNTKVNVDRKPHAFERMAGIAPKGSVEEKAVEEFLKKRPSRQWKPYRERAMDTDNAEVAEDEEKSDADADEQAQMPVMQAFPHSASGADAVESQQSYDGRLQRHTVQQQAVIQESIQNSQ